MAETEERNSLEETPETQGATERKDGDQGEKAPTPPKKWKTVLGWILTVVLILAIGFGILILVQVKKENKPLVFGIGAYYVVSGSMDPTIKVGEIILIRKVKGEDDLQKGDIITFHGKGGNLQGKTVTHRIISDGVVAGKITTCGDANHGIADTPITYDDVIGKYVKTSTVLTTVYAAFKSKYGFLFIVFIPLLILLIIQIVNFRRACKMDDDGRMPEDKTEEEIKQEAVKEKEAEIKRKAVEEYLASKKRIEEAQKRHKKE